MKIRLLYFFLGGIVLLISCAKGTLTDPVSANTPAADSIAPGIVFIGSDDGNLYALNTDDGSVLWTAKTGAAISTSPYVHTRYFHNETISSAIVVVGSEDGTLYTYDAITGAAGWTFKTGGPIVVDPVIVDDAVLVESADGRLYSLSEQTGTMQWSALVNGGVGPRFVIYQQTVYCSSKDGRVYAINKTDGSVKWSVTPGTGVSSGPVLYFNDLAYSGHYDDSIDVGVGSFDANFYKINAATGNIVYSSPYLYSVIVNAPLVFENAITYGVDATGAFDYLDQGLFIAASTKYAITRSSPTLVNRRLYIGDSNGLLYQNFTDAPGQGGSSFDTGSPIESSPVVADSIAYVGSNNNKLFAVDFFHVGDQLKWVFETGGKVRSSACVMGKQGIVYHPYFSGTQ